MGNQREESSIRSLVPWRSGTVYAILSSSMMGVMGVSLISPVLPSLRPIFGVSDAEVGLVITAYTLPGVFVTPFVGVAADRAGRKTVLVPLLALSIPLLFYFTETERESEHDEEFERRLDLLLETEALGDRELDRDLVRE